MKDDLIKYYDGTRQYWSDYHSHKETCAWNGVVLYMAFSAIIAAVNLSNNSNLYYALIISIILFSILLILLVRNQLRLKDLGGAHAVAASFLLTEIIQKDESQLNAADYLFIEESPDINAQSSHYLPRALLNKSKFMNTLGRGYQDKTKLIDYSLISISTLVVL